MQYVPKFLQKAKEMAKDVGKNMRSLVYAIPFGIAIATYIGNAAPVDEATGDNALNTVSQQQLNDGAIDWYAINQDIDLNGKIFNVDDLYLQGQFKILEYFSPSDTADFINNLLKEANNLGVPCYIIPHADSENEIKEDADAAVRSDIPKVKVNAEPGINSITAFCDRIDTDTYIFYCAPLGQDPRTSPETVIETEGTPQYSFTNLQPGVKYIIVARAVKDIPNKDTKGPLSDPVYAVPQSAPSGGGGGGCFIATAAFGDYNHPIVKVYRNFRDEYLLTNPVGRAFVRWYYAHSPAMADAIKDNEPAKAIVRGGLIAAEPIVKYPKASALAFAGLAGAAIAKKRKKIMKSVRR